MIRHDSGRFPRGDRSSKPSPAKLDHAFRSYELALKALRPEVGGMPIGRDERAKGVSLDLSAHATRQALAQAGWAHVEQKIHGRDLAEAFHKLGLQLDVSPQRIDAVRQGILRGNTVPSHEKEMDLFRAYCHGLRIVGDSIAGRMVLRPRFSPETGFSLDLRHPATQNALKAKRFALRPDDDGADVVPQFDGPPHFLGPAAPSEGVDGAFHRLALLVGVDPVELAGFVRTYTREQRAEQHRAASASLHL